MLFMRNGFYPKYQSQISNSTKYCFALCQPKDRLPSLDKFPLRYRSLVRRGRRPHAYSRGAFGLVNHPHSVYYRPAPSKQPVARIAIQLVQPVAEFLGRSLEKGPVAVGERQPFFVALVAPLGIR